MDWIIHFFLANHLFFLLPLFFVLPLLVRAFSMYADAKMPRQPESLDPSSVTQRKLFLMNLPAWVNLIAITLLGSAWLSISFVGMFKDFSSSGNSFSFFDFPYFVMSIGMPMFILVFSALIFLRYKRPQEMDKPLWGMSVTPGGDVVDDSMTKHRKIVIGLVLLILAIPFVFLAYMLLFVPR